MSINLKIWICYGHVSLFLFLSPSISLFPATSLLSPSQHLMFATGIMAILLECWILWMKYFRGNLIIFLQRLFDFYFSRQLRWGLDNLKRFLCYDTGLQAVWGRAIFISISLLFYLEKAIKIFSYFLGPFLLGGVINPTAS